MRSEVAHCLASSTRISHILDKTVGSWTRRIPTDGRDIKGVAVDTQASSELSHHADGDYLINTTTTPSMLGYYFDEAQSAQISTVVTDESNLA